MKNSKMIKKIFVLVISIALVFTFSNLVLAADDDPFLPITQNTNANPESNTNTEQTNTNSGSNTNSDSGNSLLTNTTNTTNTTNNATLTSNTVNNTTNISGNVNRSVTNTDQLAKTGLTDSNGIIALIVVLCGISAIYSYKKVNDYKKL